MTSYDVDEMIGSIIENWLTKNIKGKCRFCGAPVSENLKPVDQFCSDECRANWQKVCDARIAIGKRDLKRRGYD